MTYKLRSSNLLASSSPHIIAHHITFWHPLNVFDEQPHPDRPGDVFFAQEDIISPWLKVDMEDNFEVVKVGHFLARTGSHSLWLLLGA